jgi:Rap1a immunity proteins
VTPQTLFEECAADDSLRQVACGQYVSGVADALSTLTAAGLIANYVCIPESTPYEDMQRSVINFAKRHPDQLSGQTAFNLVLGAMVNSFPCPGPEIDTPKPVQPAP